jgi:hypothetical protein
MVLQIDEDDDESQRANRQVCCVCGATSPITQTNYTLISPKHQWRIELVVGDDGRKEPRWYCPDCWQKLKHVRQSAPNPIAAPKRPSEPSPSSPSGTVTTSSRRGDRR